MTRTLTIEGIAPGGEGFGRDGERAVFVPFTAPGDEVEAEVPPGSGPAHATLVRVLREGAERVEPPCVHFGVGEALRGIGDTLVRPSAPVGREASGEAPIAPAGFASPDRCGGCQWLHLRYEAQLAAKERAFFETLRRIAKLDPGDARRPILPSPQPLRYRARAKFHFDRPSGRLVFFRRRSHEPVRLFECHLLLSPLDALREAVGPAIARARLDVREVILEWSDHEGRGAAHLRLAALTPSARDRAAALLAAVPTLAGLVLEAEGSAPVLVGDPMLRQARVPDDPTAGVQRSRPDVFQQANRGANAVLVETAVRLLAADGANVLELFCGAGNFTAAIAARSRMVHAVEVQGPALDLARADLSGGNVRFFAGDALQLARAFARDRSAPRFDAVLLDPPREGARGIGPALRDLGASRAVYVSCDPATLARDVRGCVEAGYRVTHVQPVDMFPQTHHVEAVVLMERRSTA
ncbi:MAG TPA: TRAM domain-containing protein [Anaeromyxobacteraceae bacterium]|nr:TRAM domain-containing protein [Anaeromyxobacteraceae bacterium]